MTPTHTFTVLGVLLAISFVGLERDLWTPDEPREAEIAREMSLAPSVQQKGEDTHTAPLTPPYRVVQSRTFGIGRAWFVWERAPEALSHAGETRLAAVENARSGQVISWR